MMNAFLINNIGARVMEIIQSFLSNTNEQKFYYDPKDFPINEELRKVCEVNDIDKMSILIAMGASLDYGLEGACYTGNEKLMDEMIRLGATNFNFAIRGACCGNHKELYPKLFKYGANDPVILKSLSIIKDKELIFEMMRYDVSSDILAQIEGIEKIKMEI